MKVHTLYSIFQRNECLSYNLSLIFCGATYTHTHILKKQYIYTAINEYSVTNQNFFSKKSINFCYFFFRNITAFKYNKIRSVGSQLYITCKSLINCIKITLSTGISETLKTCFYKY